MVGIYKITNKINDKKYIGQSKNIEKRWEAHRTRPFNSNSGQYNAPLYRAIRKYGLENFNFEVIENCTIDELNKREIYWINFYDTTDVHKGYNLTKGGNYSRPIKLSEEAVNKIIILLSKSSLSQEEIALQFGVSQREISGINKGELWVKQNIVYPIRTASEIQLRKNGSLKSFCPICGKEKDRNAQLCFSCAVKKRRQDWPSREELKKLIRTNSFVSIGKKFNVSDSAIRKWCKAYGLPFRKKDIKLYSNKEWDMI